MSVPCPEGEWSGYSDTDGSGPWVQVHADFLRSLRIKHLVVEDCWYTCPAATKEVEGDTTCQDTDGKCTCGADRHNALIDDKLRELGATG